MPEPTPTQRSTHEEPEITQEESVPSDGRDAEGERLMEEVSNSKLHDKGGAESKTPEKAGDYRIDRDAQRLRSSTGIDSIGMQDTAIQESMGAIVDRSRENLGSGDAAIVGFRKSLLRMADALETGQAPMSPLHPEWYRVRSVAIVLAKGVDFIEGATDQLKAISPADIQLEVRHG